MIFHKTLLRELTSTALATFLVLLGIVLTTQLVRLLSLAAGGAITSTSVIALLGFLAIGFLPTLLSLTLFISVLMTLSRAYRDSEMVVWFSGGVSLTRWMKPVLIFALPLVFGVAVLALVLSPWAAGQAETLRKILDSRDDVSAVIPGVFRESRQADRVYFVEEVSGASNRVANVFVSSTQNGKSGVVVARQGYQETAPNGDRFLVMENGYRYEGEPGHADFRISEFERFTMRIEAREVARAQSTKDLKTLDLIRSDDPRHRGELSWRIGLPVSALLLALLAIPLSFVNPRAGRSVNLIVAVLVYMIYVNLLSVIQAYIAQSRMHLVPGILVVHAVVAVILLALFYRRLSVLSPRRLIISRLFK
ncbi:MAG TPA: LPS export ABC transporter permease LptF [Burkholderiales bacterium]|nr:LPS export ABC transporter permease LptF [Burkholderiales bacterium]